MKRVAYSYVRFSTPEQAKGNSLDRQLEASARFAAANGWHLDPTLNLRDLGRSAFNKGKQIALAGFLVAIEQGQVEEGSVLIVENLDRLSRQQIDDAYQIFRHIIKAGVDIAVLSREKVYTKKSLNSTFELLEVICSFSVANEESEKKSGRTLDNWTRKRKAALKGENKPSKRCPAWLDIVDGKYKLNKDKVKIVQQIFDWCINGVGSRQIMNRLNEHKIINIAHGQKANCRTTWNMRYVEAILSSTQSFGENQLYKMNGKERVPVGQPIKDYFPAAVSEETYFAAQAARKSRKKQRGPTGFTVSNILQNLVYDAASGHRMQCCNSSAQDKKRGIMRRLSSYHSMRTSLSWSYDDFEQHFLRAIHEINSQSVAKKTRASNPLPALEAKFDSIQARIDTLNAKLIESDDFSAGLELLAKLDLERKSVQEQIKLAKVNRQRQHSIHVEQVESLISMLAKTDGEALKELRLKLKAVIRQLISEIWVLITTVKGNRLERKLLCHVDFVDGRTWQFFIWNWKGKATAFGVADPIKANSSFKHLRVYRSLSGKARALAFADYQNDESPLWKNAKSVPFHDWLKAKEERTQK